MPNESAPAAGEFLLYQTEDGQTRIECRFEAETIWLSRPLMAELFQTTPQNITLHLKAIYRDAELDEAATSKDCLPVQEERACQVQRLVKHYKPGYHSGGRLPSAQPSWPEDRN